MTISILKLTPGQQIPRPFNRAGSPSEAAELIASYEAAELHRMKRDDAQAHAGMAGAEPAEYLDLQNINTDEPVYVMQHRVGQRGRTKFYAFTE